MISGLTQRSFSSLERYIKQKNSWLIQQQTLVISSEGNLSKVIEQAPLQGVEVAAYLKVHYSFSTMFLQTHQEVLYLKEIFQSVHSKFLNTLDHLQNDPTAVETFQIIPLGFQTVRTIWYKVFFLV